MTYYYYIILMMGGVGAYIGLENLLLFLYGRRRFHLWVGLVGLTHCLYSLITFAARQVSTFEEAGKMQNRQLSLAMLLVDLLLILGLEHLGRLRRVHLYAMGTITLILEILLWIPGLGVTAIPSVKVIQFLGMTYLRVKLGPIPILFFIITACVMGVVGALLVKRAWKGSWTDRAMAGVFTLWYLAGANDMMVASGFYPFLYLVELVFFPIVLVIAAVSFGVQHQSGMAAEKERRQLAREIKVKDRDLAATQAKLTEAAKMAAVGRLAAGVAHEINNPLTYVLGNLQMLVQELRDDEELAIMAKEAVHGAIRIQKVVRQLSTFARADAGTIPGRVENALDSSVRMAMAEIKDRALLQLEVPDLPPVAMDEGHLAQVLLNLLINAAQSIPPGHRDENCILIKAQSNGDLVEILVEDTGGGIAPEVLPHIFEPFFTTKEVGQGEGLGLSISRTLLSATGGSISAQNVRPRGARFTIQLPVYRTDSPRISAQRGKTLTAETSRRLDARPSLLLVDDDPNVLGTLRRTLENTFEVATATSGNEALELINGSEGSRFDLILCDVMMPNGSGFDVIQALGRTRPELLSRLILMTGGASGKEKDSLSRDPSLPVLEKPFTLEELLNLLTDDGKIRRLVTME